MNLPLTSLFHPVLFVGSSFFLINIRIIDSVHPFFLLNNLYKALSTLLAGYLGQSTHHLIVLFLANVAVVLTVDHPISLILPFCFLHYNILNAVAFGQLHLEFFLVVSLVLAFHLIAN